MKEKDWEKKLTPTEYKILREKGTEAAFSGKYVNHKEDGTYTCSGCGNPLFSSKTKFNSKSGWPSFTDVIDGDQIELKDDDTQGMHRTEVICKNCGAI